MSESRDKSVVKLVFNGNNGQEGWLSLPVVVDGVMFVLLVAMLTLIYSPMVLRPPYLPAVGEVAARDIKADRDILIEDLETTTMRRREAVAKVAPVYEWDPGMMEPIMSQLDDALTWLAATRKAWLEQEILRLEKKSKANTPAAGEGVPTVIQNVDVEAIEVRLPREDLESFAQRLQEPVPGRALDILQDLEPERTEALITGIHKWLERFGEQPVVDSLEVLSGLGRISEYIANNPDGEERKDFNNDEVIELAGMRRLLGRTIDQWLGAFPRELLDWLLEEVRAQVRPNLVLNLIETQLRRKRASDAVSPVYFRARRGEMVVREGAVVTEAIRLKLETLNESRWTEAMVMRIVGLTVVLAVLLWLGRWFLFITSNVFPRDRRTTYMLGSILVVCSLLSVIALVVGQGVAELMGWPVRMAVYLPHPALGSALASLVVGARVGIPGGALIMGTILAFLGALVADGGLPLFVYYMIGALVGGATLRTCRKRFEVLRSGMTVGLFQMMAVPMVELLAGSDLSWNWLLGAGIAMTSGLLMGFWGLALIPLLEMVFNVTTDSRLMELSSGDHPLVRELSLRSPGTYHHSIMMGNLAEAAAENINANPLLARVMALYHDIGKMTKSHYFVENQSGENRHDHLAPSMSTKIIMAHVKDGLELARRYKLGEPIQEAIISHHGTSLLQYFHNRAMKQAAKRQTTVSAEAFRYAGPKPRSREAGILMLADSVEAAARTLKTPSPAQIQALVRRIVNAKIQDGQLDDCCLTLREIALIEEAFTRVLTLGFYHHRIEYPDQVAKHKKGMRTDGKGSGQSRSPRVAAA